MKKILMDEAESGGSAGSAVAVKEFGAMGAQKDTDRLLHPIPADSSHSLPQLSKEEAERLVAAERDIAMHAAGMTTDAVAFLSAKKIAITKDETAGDMITVNVPASFRFTLDNHCIIMIEKGVQKLERFVVEHWYAEANGVKPYEIPEGAIKE